MSANTNNMKVKVKGGSMNVIWPQCFSGAKAPLGIALFGKWVSGQKVGNL